MSSRVRAKSSFEISALGDAALLVRVADSLGKVLATEKRLRSAKIAGVKEIVPGFASVALFFESPVALERAAEEIADALSLIKTSAPAPPARLVKIPVCYDRELAPDLETVAQHSGLSPNELALCHTRPEYRVRCVGFTPGFPYLSGLPAALAMPRRATPRVVVAAGSVGIGGRQTGIYPIASPGGWNIIGRTPLQIFNPTHEPAALLRPGDRVRFVAISRDEFEQWAR